MLLTSRTRGAREYPKSSAGDKCDELSDAAGRVDAINVKRNADGNWD